MMKALLLALGFLLPLLLPTVLDASPLSEAQTQARTTFDWPQSSLSASDRELVEQPWARVPLDQSRFTFTFEQIRQKWPVLMRGLKLDFPSPDYLKTRYLKFPGLLQTLKYKDSDWQQHSYNVLEVWQAFFRGDFQHASQLGKKYGGYAQVPGVLSEIIAAVYLMPTLAQKQALLRDAILRISSYGQQFPFVPGDQDFKHDYAMMRLGFAYAIGRLAEDESIAEQLSSKHAVIAMNAATELLADMPHHPMGLGLAGGIDANVIRRVGKLLGSMSLNVHAFDAEMAFRESIQLVPDMAILRYEYANSLLYTNGRESWPEAQKQLQIAAGLTPQDAMEALDIAYAKKHLALLQPWAAGQQSYRSFDAGQRSLRVEHNINGYCVLPVGAATVEGGSGEASGSPSTGSSTGMTLSNATAAETGAVPLSSSQQKESTPLSSANPPASATPSAAKPALTTPMPASTSAAVPTSITPPPTSATTVPATENPTSGATRTTTSQKTTSQTNTPTAPTK
jgi:hypothetical protein